MNVFLILKFSPFLVSLPGKPRWTLKMDSEGDLEGKLTGPTP